MKTQNRNFVKEFNKTAQDACKFIEQTVKKAKNKEIDLVGISPEDDGYEDALFEMPNFIVFDKDGYSMEEFRGLVVALDKYGELSVDMQGVESTEIKNLSGDQIQPADMIYLAEFIRNMKNNPFK